jgi:hypothetical protein
MSELLQWAAAIVMLVAGAASSLVCAAGPCTYLPPDG